MRAQHEYFLLYRIQLLQKYDKKIVLVQRRNKSLLSYFLEHPLKVSQAVCFQFLILFLYRSLSELSVRWIFFIEENASQKTLVENYEALIEKQTTNRGPNFQSVTKGRVREKFNSNCS